MASSNNVNAVTNIYTSLGIKNKGIGGLASGLDTESLVQALTMSTRNKIAVQQQQRQKLVWQQTAYRSVVSTLKAFQTKNLSFSSSNTTNIRSAAFFNSFDRYSSSTAVTVTGGNTAANFEITDIKLATNQTLVGTATLDKDLIGDVIDPSTTTFTGKELKITMDGGTRTVKLDSLQGTTNLQQDLQDLIDLYVGKKADNTSKITVNFTGGKVALTSDREVVVDACAALGFDKSNGNRYSYNTKLKDLGMGIAGGTLEFKLNGATVSISADSTVNDLMSAIQNSPNANARLTYSAADKAFKLTSTLGGSGHVLDVEDVNGNLMNALFGAQASSSIKSGTSIYQSGIAATGTISSMTSLDKETLTNMSFGIQINDGYPTTIKADFSSYQTELKDGTLTEAMITDALNKGIKNALGNDTDIEFQLNGSTLELHAPGTDVVTLTTTNSALATPAFNALKYMGFANNTNNLADLTDTALTLGELGITGSGDIEINGVALGVNYSSSDTLDSFISQINAAANAALSTTGVEYAKIVYDKIENGKPVGGKVVFDAVGGITISDTDTSPGGAMQKLFGTSSYEQKDAITAAAEAADLAIRTNAGRGVDARVTLADGRVIDSFSNNITIDGVSITLNEAVSADNIQIRVTSNPNDVIERIKLFIDEYNTMVETLNRLTSEAPVSAYTALSDEQKADMTTDEIEKWETEAKKGLLYNDRTIRGIVDSLRSTIYTTIESVGLTPYEVGITSMDLTSSANKTLDAGKLEITAKGEERLRAAFANNPDAVKNLFTNENDGLATKMYNVIQRAVETSSDPTKRGSLIIIAGSETITGNNSSTLASKIDRIDKFVTTLKARLESEYNRYWKQFSALEVALQNMNAQSSWLMSFGS